MQVHERLEKILKELEEIKRFWRSKAIDDAIECLKIALHGERIGSEGFEHSYIREKLLNIFGGGNVYLESEGTKISKIGFRPDIVIIRGKDVIIAEIENDKREVIKKIVKVAERIEKLKRHPVLANRNLRIVFATSDWDEKIISKVRNFGFEFFAFNGDTLIKIV